MTINPVITRESDCSGDRMTQPGKPAPAPRKEESVRAIKGQPEHSLSRVSKAFLENSDFLKNFLKRFLTRAEDIDDIAQEAYLNAYHAERERGVEQPKAYLFRVAKNLALNELNKKSRQMTDYIEDRLAVIPLESKDQLEDEIEAEQSLRIYSEAVAALPKRCRRVFLMRKVNGMRHQEIADSLGITTSAVEKHLHNAAKSCRAYISRANTPTAAPPRARRAGSAIHHKSREA